MSDDKANKDKNNDSLSKSELERRVISECKEVLTDIKPVIRDIFWISQCWNDHNFSEKDLLDKCKKISKALLGVDLKPNCVNRANSYLNKIDSICDSI